jgi:hypothetical protein
MLADTLDAMLADVPRRHVWARNGQRRVHAHFLVLAQLGAWMRLLAHAA